MPGSREPSRGRRRSGKKKQGSGGVPVAGWIGIGVGALLLVVATAFLITGSGDDDAAPGEGVADGEQPATGSGAPGSPASSSAPGSKAPADPPVQPWAPPPGAALRIPIAKRTESLAGTFAAFPLARADAFLVGTEVVRTGNGRVLGSTPELQRPPEPLLSSSGRYVAGRRIDSSDHGVWDTENGRQVMSQPFELQEFTFFAADKWALVRRVGPHSAIVDVHELPSGRLVRDITLPSRVLTPSEIATSPGGRYFAYAESSGRFGPGNDPRILIYDIASGEVQASRTPKKENGERARIEGVEFSPDGTEIAALLVSPNWTHIRSWRLQTGDVSFRRSFPSTEISGTDVSSLSRPLQWFPSGDRILLGERYVIDRIPQPLVDFGRPLNDLVFRHVIDEERVLEIQSGHYVTVAVPPPKVSPRR